MQDFWLAERDVSPKNKTSETSQNNFFYVPQKRVRVSPTGFEQLVYIIDDRNIFLCELSLLGPVNEI